MITEMKGDLLADDASALVNPVNCHGAMGKGLALEFKKAFPDMFASYRTFCVDRRMVPGVLHSYRVPDGRWVINFPTKLHWRNKSRLAYVEEGMLPLVAAVHGLHLESVAIPALGCGEGGLAWADVKPLIVACFKDVDVDVRLYGPQ